MCFFVAHEGGSWLQSILHKLELKGELLSEARCDMCPVPLLRFSATTSSLAGDSNHKASGLQPTLQVSQTQTHETFDTSGVKHI